MRCDYAGMRTLRSTPSSRTRNARYIAHLRAAVDCRLPRRRDTLPARQASARQAAAESAIRRRQVPWRPGRRPGRVPRLRGGELASHRGTAALPGHADERARPVRGPPACPCRAAATPRPARRRRVGRPCLYPDKYSYRYGDHQIGAGDPLLDAPPAGWGCPPACPCRPLDLNPLDVTDPADLSGSMPSSGRSTHTAAPGCEPLPPTSPPTRHCSCAAT